ncbi:DUF429 domain-containing protein [Paraburkholderia sp. CNPSo 3076]|uniref:DUF429 domain-containing protein n=1 Tax=Paraburkholderia sp. CNPSo 3076 TaxID=2940936 RepID=UPI0022569A57|nr:DUF429 domain-containing protein [Paraburkholderia sp. CNPSo 3076]MCX5537948.1 DUF429 domain-containing protein [Paraburkholderia sp. CNPSo 3076]
MNTRTVAGIDVGGDKKGCHLVILEGSRAFRPADTKTPQEMLQACLEYGVQAVGIDAPCQWGVEGEGRRAERELARQRIFSFATPTRKRADENPGRFYRWMFNGEVIYQVFTSDFPLLSSRDFQGGRVSFETFPHAVTCALRGKEGTSAKEKRRQRPEVLESAMIDASGLKSIDDFDAALCALTARYLVEGRSYAYGDVEGGYIHVPIPLSLNTY